VGFARPARPHGEKVTQDGLFRGPTSVIIFGDDRALLDWVAYALAVPCDPNFIWTDVRLKDQEPSPDDPIATQRVPADQLRVRPPWELQLDHSTANIALSAVVRSDEPPENVRRLIDYLRLPAPTQRVLSEPHGTSRLPVVVLSNSHRMAPFYRTLEDVSSTAQTIKASGVVMIMTFADAPPGGRVAFEAIVHVDGSMRAGWKQATLRVEKASPAADLPAGPVVRLGEFEPIASVLRRELG